MKKLQYLLISLCMVLLLCGCEKTLQGTDDLIAKAREVIPVAEADTIDIAYAGLCAKDDKARIWFVSGNAYQAHYYLPMECNIVGRNAYTFSHVYNPMDRGTDIAVVLWQGGYCFLVNNPQCTAIRITDGAGTRDIPVEKAAYPFIYYMEQIPSSYYFLDVDGNEVS